MVGLSASQLQAETLFPGDTVEYFSMAFVAGDPRGHRVAKVLRVDRQDDEFPIRLDTQEMLPLTLMLKRKQDRNGLDISSHDAKWRKLRTFKLVDGEVEGETRADRLNAGLKQGLADAFKATQKQIAKEKDEKGNAGSKNIMTRFLKGPVDGGETTSSARSSLEKSSTPERRKKKRKPLTPRENTAQYSSKRAPDKDVPRKSRLGGKSSVKSRSEDKPVRPERHQQNESNKHSSLKRKRSDSKLRKQDAASRNHERSISKFFGEPKQARQKKRAGIDLSKFVDHAQEDDSIEKIKQQKKKRTTTLNEYLALDEVEKKIKADGGGGSSDSADKKAWNEKRTQYRKTNKAPATMRSWLTKLEEVSGGTPKKSHEPKERRLNLARDKSESPRMNRKSGISFMLPTSSGGTCQKKETPRSQHREVPVTTKRLNQPRKKPPSLGTVSARTPKPQSSSWITRKAAR